MTLLGPGGTGKTRLSIEVAARIAPEFHGRVWFVPLADLPEPSRIPNALLHALNLPPTPGEDPLDSVIALLSQSPSLLVLDNLEHLLQRRDASGGENSARLTCVAFVRRLLDQTPGLKCLTTSRQPLHLGGEQQFPLLSLDLPDAEAVPEKLMEVGSIALYTDRARSVRPDFAVTETNATSVAALCRKLEGIPLAIEMAAAWARMLPPARILERLERQLDVMVTRRSDLPQRHQSLRATIEWSYDLLSEELRTGFCRLAAFRGGWTLEAAESVLAPEGMFGLDVLAELQEQSMIVLETRDEETRYRMLEPLREFAAEKLKESGAEAATRQAHAAFFGGLIEEACSHMNSPGVKVWMDRLETEQDNIRAALAWHETYAPENGLHLVGCLWRYWELRGSVREGRACLRVFLERCGDEPPTSPRTKAHCAAGMLAAVVGDYADAMPHYERALRIAEQVGDGHAAAMAKQQMALAAQEQGDNATAWHLLKEVIAMYQAQGERNLVANNLCNLAVIAIDREDYAQAQEFLSQALSIQRELGDMRSIAIALNNLGDVAMELGNYEAARAYQAESLRITCELGAKRSVAYALESFACIAAREAQWERAVYLWGGAQALREANAYPLTPAEQKIFEKQVAEVSPRLSGEAFAAAWNAGRAASLRQTMEIALEPVSPSIVQHLALKKSK